MIIIYCEAYIDPEKQAEFIEKVNASGLIEATNQEPGNISYELSASVGTPGKLYILERWESQKALPAHMKSPNFAAISKLRAEYGVSSDFNMYRAELMK